MLYKYSWKSSGYDAEDHKHISSKGKGTLKASSAENALITVALNAMLYSNNECYNMNIEGNVAFIKFYETYSGDFETTIKVEEVKSGKPTKDPRFGIEMVENEKECKKTKKRLVVKDW